MPLEIISIETILARLKTNQIGRHILYIPTMPSTMDIAMKEVLRGAPHGTAIIAGMQENGKGRLNRSWVSPAGGVYVSIIVYPPQGLISSLTIIASLAITDCIWEVCGIRADIKWPNDVLIDGKKVSGILAQSGSSPTKGCYAIVGIGINANVDLTSQPEIASISTSISTATGKLVSLEVVICSFLENFEKRYDALSLGAPLWQEWRDRLVTLGKFVSVKSGESVFEGLAESVTPEGSLLLRQADSTLKEIPAGDVTLRL